MQRTNDSGHSHPTQANRARQLYPPITAPMHPRRGERIAGYGRPDWALVGVAKSGNRGYSMGDGMALDEDEESR